MKTEARVTSLAEAKAKGTEPGVFMGEPLKLEIGDAEAVLAAAPHKVDVALHHAAPQPQLHRTARCTLAWEGDTCGSTTPPRRWPTGLDLAQVFGLERSRCASPRPSSAADSAASSCGITRFSPPPPRARAAGRCASCCPAKGCFASSAAAPLTEQRVAIGAQADGPLRRPDPHRRPSP